MKIILFGKNGQLGWELQRVLPVLGDVVSLGRDDIDISNPLAVKKVLSELKPTLIINASAYTEVDLAETQSDMAEKINGISPGVMAETAHKIGAVLIHYSTDYIFDGIKRTPYIEEDLPNPLNIYGRSKLMGEANIKQTGDAYIILRTSWVYSMRGNSFVNKVLGWARKSQTLRIVSDQTSNPTWARMLAITTSLMVAQNKIDLFEKFKTKHGIYHLAGDGYTSRYEWAKHILANDPKQTEQLTQAIEPALSENFPTPAIRPQFSALNCMKFENTFDLRLPGWEESLKLAMAG